MTIHHAKVFLFAVYQEFKSKEGKLPIKPASKKSKRFSACLLNCVIFIFLCGFSVFGIREWYFPATKVCEIEKLGDKELLDISEVLPFKNNVELVGHVGGEATSIFVRNKRVFAKLGYELAIFDIRNPSSPERIGYIMIPGELIYVDDESHFAYVYYDEYYNQGLWKVDVSDPTKMSAELVYNPKDAVTSVKIAREQVFITTIHCESLYLMEGSINIRCDDALHVVDTTSNSLPIRCSQDFFRNAFNVLPVWFKPELITPPTDAFEGGYSYRATGIEGIKIYDATNKENLVEIGTYAPPYDLSAVFTYDTKAFVKYLFEVNNTGHAQLRVFDIENPADPMEISELNFNPELLAKWNNFAYLIEYDNRNVEILDLSKPSLGTHPAPEHFSKYFYMTIIGSKAYVVTNLNEFQILDISEPGNPMILGSYPLSYPYVYGISIKDNYGYIISRNEGMHILDLSNEANITEVGLYEMKTIPVSLSLWDHYALIGEEDRTLEIVDVSKPQQPNLIHIYDAGGEINDIQVVNHYAFGLGYSGLQILDISEPTSPQLIGSFTPGEFTTGLDVKCPYVYLTTFGSGLYILRLNTQIEYICD